jgi:hypothetical protein
MKGRSVQSHRARVFFGRGTDKLDESKKLGKLPKRFRRRARRLYLDFGISRVMLFAEPFYPAGVQLTGPCAASSSMSFTSASSV